MAEEITRSLTEKEKYQEEVFDKKAGEKKLCHRGQGQPESCD